MTLSSVHRVCVMSEDCRHIVINMVVVSTCETCHCHFRHQMSITVFTQTTRLTLLDILWSSVVVNRIWIFEK